MMSTEMKKVNNETTNENTTNENTQAQPQAAENQQPAQAPQPEEKKEGLGKKIWNKVKKPLVVAAAIAGGFGAGVLTDHFVLGKNDSNQVDGAAGADSQSEGSNQ